jgi:plasmid stabilization system protein ParE
MEVIFHRLAAQEYLAVRRWYAQRSPQVAQAFADEVDRAAEKIAANPGQGPVFRQRYRWVRTRRFPYLLYYHVLDANRVLVMAVAHARRRPGYWQRRSRS